MIDDDDVTLGRAAPHLGNEAAVVFFTLLAEAGIGPGIKFVPEGARLGQFREFGAIAGLGCLFPRGDGAIVLDLFEAAEHGLVGEINKLLAAEIIIAALHVTDAEFAISIRKKRTLQSRNIFKEKLL